MAKPAAPRRPSASRKPSVVSAGWLTFLSNHPTPYTAAFAKRTPMPKGFTLTRLVQATLKTLAVGKWATCTFRKDGASVVLVAFADKADFDRVKTHHKGQAWSSSIKGAIDGFQVVLP